MSTNQIALKLLKSLLKRHPNHLITGCTDNEIEKIMNAQNVSFLPESYKQVLKLMGKSGLDRAIFCDSLYNDLLSMKQYGKELFDYVDNVALPDDAFVFAMHHGYILWYFPTSIRLENPPVYGYKEEDPNTKKIQDQLSDFWTSSIEAGK